MENRNLYLQLRLSGQDATCFGLFRVQARGIRLHRPEPLRLLLNGDTLNSLTFDSTKEHQLDRTKFMSSGIPRTLLPVCLLGVIFKQMSCFGTLPSGCWGSSSFNVIQQHALESAPEQSRNVWIYLDRMTSQILGPARRYASGYGMVVHPLCWHTAWHPCLIQITHATSLLEPANRYNLSMKLIDKQYSVSRSAN